MTNAVVFGVGASAIADALARQMIASGQSVTGVHGAADTESAESLRAELGSSLRLIEANFSDQSSIEEAVTGLGSGIRWVVFAHMYFNLENRMQFDFADWNRALAENLTAPLIVAECIAGQLSSDASFVVVTSTEAFRGSFRAAGYAATKAAVHNLVMTLANNAGSRGVRFNAVAPGWIGGVMDTDEVFEMSKRITPLGRLGRPEEVASAVRFLLSDEASFVNGTVLTVDGGYCGVDTIAKYEAENTPE